MPPHLIEASNPCLYLGNEVNKYPGYEDWEPQNADLASTPDEFYRAILGTLWPIRWNLPTIDLYFTIGREKYSQYL